MTISEEKRLAAMSTALEYMLEKIEDQPIFAYRVDAKEGPLADLPDTTWTELVEAGLVERHKAHNPPPRYLFTPLGWIAAHEITGALSSEKVRDRGQRMVAMLKEAKRHHHGDVFVGFRTLLRKLRYQRAGY